MKFRDRRGTFCSTRFRTSLLRNQRDYLHFNLLEIDQLVNVPLKMAKRSTPTFRGQISHIIHYDPMRINLFHKIKTNYIYIWLFQYYKVKLSNKIKLNIYIYRNPQVIMVVSILKCFHLDDSGIYSMFKQIIHIIVTQ